jgi:thymidine kinase
MKMKSELVSSASEILTLLNQTTQVVGIDEAQFFELDLVSVCNRMADIGKRVIVAGLDQDYRAHPFDPMPQLLAVAEYITKTLAICVRCGAPANRTQRIDSGTERVRVGAGDVYEARCRSCFEPPTD